MKISRNISVDVYRFVLCAFIILFHYTIRFTQLFVNGDFSLWFVPDAYVVVSIFFIISGFFFSIESLKTFIYKKIWCLYMPFVLSIIIISAVELSLSNLNSISMFDVASNILVVPVMLGIGKYVDGAHWYIVSLLLFFLVLSVFYLVSKAAKKNKLFYVFVAAYAFLCFASYRITGSSIAEKAFRIVFSNRLVFACLGIFIKRIKISKQLNEIVSIALMILVFCIHSIFLNCSNINIVYFLVLLGILLFCLFKPVKSNSRFLAVLSFIGRRTLYIYLLHQCLGYIFIIKTINSISYPLSILLAFLSANIVGLLFGLLWELFLRKVVFYERKNIGNVNQGK
jgi:peptidoglycan/LPS O-acetylase OafA/YrhL